MKIALLQGAVEQRGRGQHHCSLRSYWTLVADYSWNGLNEWSAKPVSRHSRPGRLPWHEMARLQALSLRSHARLLKLRDSTSSSPGVLRCEPSVSAARVVMSAASSSDRSWPRQGIGQPAVAWSSQEIFSTTEPRTQDTGGPGSWPSTVGPRGKRKDIKSAPIDIASRLLQEAAGQAPTLDLPSRGARSPLQVLPALLLVSQLLFSFTWPAWLNRPRRVLQLSGCVIARCTADSVKLSPPAP